MIKFKTGGPSVERGREGVDRGSWTVDGGLLWSVEGSTCRLTPVTAPHLQDRFQGSGSDGGVEVLMRRLMYF